jgi:mRNA-degrading endonuclease RelE of RelBE toxin-antitoxin system
MIKYPVKFTHGFVDELSGAIFYYEKISPELASRFKKAVEKQLRIIEVNPLAKSIRYSNIRFARIEDFPYAIHYSVNDKLEVILINKIVSTHRNPEIYWSK